MATLSALRAAAASEGSSTFDLHISDPASILNEIARRYEFTERILMEFIDNALDDAEELYRANAEAYPYEIRIEIILDVRRRFIIIRDNCRGMQREKLERIVQNVGESQKRGLTWVNGQFGFGVHAFRAAAEAIWFRTKHREGDHLELRLQRDQYRGIRRPWSSSAPFPSETGTGTEVTVGPFEDEWFAAVSVDSIRREIETHFERLLARPNLSITVCEADEMPTRCAAFDYSQIPGEDFRRDIDLEVGGRIYPIEVHLKVAEIEVPERRARFFRRGRCINEVVEIKSFLRKSGRRTGVWGHPHLLGSIEVGEIVRPVITRDDFQRSSGRTAFYEAILSLEEEIKEALDRVNEAHRDNSLSHLEDILRDVLEKLSREDRMRLRSELTPGNGMGSSIPGGGAEGGTDDRTHEEKSGTGHPWDGMGDDTDSGREPETDGPRQGEAEGGHQVTEDPSQNGGAQRRRTGLDIKFGNYPSVEGRLRRSHLIDGVIYINTGHPDFQERMAYSRQGQPRFNDRLGAYLAATVSIHYKDQFYLRYRRQPDRPDQMFDDMVDFMCRLEAALRPHLATLQQELANQNGEEELDE